MNVEPNALCCICDTTLEYYNLSIKNNRGMICKVENVEFATFRFVCSYCCDYYESNYCLACSENNEYYKDECECWAEYDLYTFDEFVDLLKNKNNKNI